MTRSEIIELFRQENTEFPARVISTAVAENWCKIGDKDVCARTRCIVDQDGTTIETSEDDQYWVLTDEIDNFYDIDAYPGGEVTYNDLRLDQTTIAELDREARSWRSRSSGTPRKWYRRGNYLYVDRPIDSNEEDIKVYSVLLSDDWESDVAPFNALSYLEPFHYIMVLYLTWRAKAKIGKRQDSIKAVAEYVDYAKWMKSQLGGTKYGPIRYQRKI